MDKLSHILTELKDEELPELTFDALFVSPSITSGELLFEITSIVASFEQLTVKRININNININNMQSRNYSNGELVINFWSNAKKPYYNFSCYSDHLKRNQ